jgi:peptide/nickel transport system permease protein
MRAKYGLDQPLPEQFLRYTGALATLDFGYSFLYQAPVARVIASYTPPSLLLGCTALVAAAFSGFLLGVLTAARPYRALDAAVRVAGSIVYSAPVFWTGQVLIILVAVKLGVLPAGGMTSAREDLSGMSRLADVAHHLILPATALALPFVAVIASVTRAAVLQALSEPFVLAAAARGVPRIALVGKHAAANAAVPVIALIGEHATSVVAGAALTEALFAWPGLGYLVLHASLNRDYPLVIATFILISSAVVITNAATDVVCARLDPRISLT